jgi:hypothetical protein
LNVARAAELFSGHDDLTIDMPNRDDMPSTQNWETVDEDPGPGVNLVPLARQSRGDYSWIITVVPKTAGARNALASGGGGHAYDVSVVVFYKRRLSVTDPASQADSRAAGDLLQTEERLTRARVVSSSPSGGELLLDDWDGFPSDPFDLLKVGQWVLLGGPHPDSNDVAPRFSANWYRVVAIDGKDTQLGADGNTTTASGQPRRRLVSLRGPQWPWQPANGGTDDGAALANNLCLCIFPGAVAVHNRTIQLESSSAFGGSGGGGGASAVTPSKYVPY